MATCSSSGGGKGKGGATTASTREKTAKEEMSKKVASNFSETIDHMTSPTTLERMKGDIEKNTYLTKEQAANLLKKIDARIDSLTAEKKKITEAKKPTETKPATEKKAETKKTETKKAEPKKAVTVKPKVEKPKKPKKESTKITEKQYSELASLAKSYGYKVTAKDMKMHIKDYEDDYLGGRKLSYSAVRELIYNGDFF